MFCTVAENMINAGGPMGGPDTTTMWRKFFTTKRKAMKYCEKHYREETERSAEKLKWTHRGKNRVHSRNLCWVMYTIFKVETEN
jgi:hypothetical protein